MEWHHLSLRQLQVLKAVAEAGSMAQAARELFMTGPAVTQQIKQLEKVLGAPAFDRVGRKLKITAAGERTLAAATDVQGRLGLLAKEMDALKKRDDGTLHLGILATGTHILPPLLAEFRRRAPGIAVHMAVSSREGLVQRLMDGEVDLALMGRGPEAQQTRRALAEDPLTREPFASNPHLVIAWPGHPLAGEPAIPPIELRHESFVQREPGSGTRAMLDSFLEMHRIVPRERLTVSGNEMAKHAVMSRLGISLTSAHTLFLELRSRVLVRLDVEHTPIVRTWYVVHHARRWLPPAAVSFRDYLLTDGAPRVEAETRRLLTPDRDDAHSLQSSSVGNRSG
ncbi:MAG TPA: LysR family transcriptional regulator [Steroidobacteraceae bacterium]|nr:LysR family transcriptional regulator [Steroidobacteraceae bacterium]